MQQRSSFSVEEFAFRNGFSRAFAYSELKAGRLASVKIGKLRRITAEHEAEYLARHEERAGATVAGGRQ